MSWGPFEDEPEDPAGNTGGWVPPEARSWRHPSEVHSARVAAVLTAAQGWRRGATLVVGVTAIMAIVAGALLLAETGSSPGTSTIDTMPVGTAAVTSCCELSPTLTRDTEEAVVSIEDAAGSGASGCGVVVGDGLVVTTLAALEGDRKVRVVTATGQLLDGTVLAADSTSGVALVRLGASLHTAPVDVGDTLGNGTPALAVAMQPAADGRSPKALWTSATVVSVGEAPPGAPATSMAEITVRGASVPVMPGEPLVGQDGRVEGILDGSHGTERSFLPMSLVVGVSDDLETMGKVRHGWLGVTDASLHGTAGAKILWVDPHGAAARVLHPGDVIVRVDGGLVRSSAELRSMLYVMAPGTRVSIEALRGTRVVRAVVELAPSP